MKNLLLMAAAVAALAVTARPAAAQYPAGPVVPAGGCAQCDSGYGAGGCGYGGYGGGGFGGHGFGGGHVGAVGGKLKSGLFGFGLFHGLFSNHGGGGGPRDIPVVDPRSGNAGQLAFPQNPFIRSPRDYFMWDER
jgi:hypothetical protein